MIVDYRCTLSGVSLLGAQTMGVLVSRAPQDRVGHHYLPSALPLWGRYEGTGSLAEVQEGPNADSILQTFLTDLSCGQATLEWDRLGVSQVPIEHVETLLALIRVNAIHSLHALTWRGRHVDVAFFESNVAAAKMQDEPAYLMNVKVDDLPAAVFGKDPIAQAIYATAFAVGPQVRCRYGLSLVGMASLCEHVDFGRFDESRRGYSESDRDPARWLAEAYRDHGSDDSLREALEEYTEGLLGDEVEGQDELG